MTINIAAASTGRQFSRLIYKPEQVVGGQILVLTGIEIFVAFDAGIIGDLADKDSEVC